MVDKRLAVTVTGALAQLEWEEEDVGGAQLVSTGIESIPHFVLRTTTCVDSSAVLDMCCPFVGNPTDEAVLLALRSNAPLAADGSFLSSYVGAQRGGYLGGFVRVPVPAGLWLVEAVCPMLYLGARSLAMLRARVPGFIEACQSKGYSADSEVFRTFGRRDLWASLTDQHEPRGRDRQDAGISSCRSAVPARLACRTPGRSQDHHNGIGRAT